MAFPEYIRELWEPLRNEVIKVHAYWLAYKQLYEYNKKRTEKVRAESPMFFDVVRELLIDHIQLILSRLGGPPESRGKQNATLETLINELKNSDVNELFLSEATTSLNDFRKKCEQMRDRRNKQIAHSDYKTLLHQYAHDVEAVLKPPIQPATRKEIEEALESVASFMNEVEGTLTLVTNEAGNTKYTKTDYRYPVGDKSRRFAGYPTEGRYAV